MTIRNAAKALIVRDDKVLLVKYRTSSGEDLYTIPGGGQNCLESMEEAVVRECLEETGYLVSVDGFLALYEEIITDPLFQKKHPAYAHKIFHIFLCRLLSDEPRKPTEEDAGQTGCEWVELERLDSIKILPEVLHNHIRSLMRGDGPMYLGTDRISLAH